MVTQCSCGPSRRRVIHGTIIVIVVLVIVVGLRAAGVDLSGPITAGAAGALTAEIIARLCGRPRGNAGCQLMPGLG
jgi:hypothetical protein